MPDYDSGHYFYTGLFPVDLRPTRRSDQSITSHSHLLREELAELPNFSPDDRAALPSPFSRCRRTHFARLSVVDDPAFNGRVQEDALVAAVTGVDLLLHQPVDHFSRSWLVFVADADVPDGSDASRDLWAQGLWEVMEPELRALFRHCLGFGNVEDGQAFAAYLAKGQVETTMSFNDYWIDPPNLPVLGAGTLAAAAGAALLVFLGTAWLIQHYWRGGWWLWVLAALLGVGAALWAVYCLVMSRGAKSYPAGWEADLPGVLKSLYVQQHFTRFAMDNQGASPADLHAAFGRFLGEVSPADRGEPTQKPGLVPERLRGTAS
ncbi:MAG: hypothetical protein JOZ90_15625 [Alphaproteobacteria bacterium]|nr:hypothetical protein [Alphaproteobacteria bacterium]MBV9371728.1 hypothetical protein [Alphaproteobacteria bacterium]MBV9902504.1 hypothetical protein [Alphaproteobacteria bacterium]